MTLATLLALSCACSCGVVPERQNDFYWENEIFGMRAYGPGEDHCWSGLDVFNKMPGSESVGSLLRNHNRRGNWHVTPANGILDNYTVGAGRGCGAVALFGDGEWKTYPNWETCEIITNTADAIEFKLMYPAFSLAGRMTYHITMAKGDPFFRNNVSFERPFKGAIAGPALDINPARNHKGKVYEDSDKGIITLFEDDRGEAEGATMTAVFADPNSRAHLKLATDHLGCRVIAFDGISTNFSYYAGAQWSKRGNIKSPEDWTKFVTFFRGILAK